MTKKDRNSNKDAYSKSINKYGNKSVAGKLHAAFYTKISYSIGQTSGKDDLEARNRSTNVPLGNKIIMTNTVIYVNI